MDGEWIEWMWRVARFRISHKENNWIKRPNTIVNVLLKNVFILLLLNDEHFKKNIKTNTTNW